jgi:hypothetical protein
MNIGTWLRRVVLRAAWRLQGLSPLRIEELEFFEEAVQRARKGGVLPQELMWLISRRISSGG